VGLVGVFVFAEEVVGVYDERVTVEVTVKVMGFVLAGGVAEVLVVGREMGSSASQGGQVKALYPFPSRPHFGLHSG